MEEKIKELIKELEEDTQEILEDINEVKKLYYTVDDVKEFSSISINYYYKLGLRVGEKDILTKLKSILESEVENE